jgi:hypothetical protein
LVVDPLAAGCRVPQSQWVTLPVGTSSRKAKVTRQELRDHLGDLARRLQHVDATVIQRLAPSGA